jgi:hypothetical protein
MFIFKSIYKIIVLIMIILKNLIILFYKKLFKFSHKFEILYIKKLKDGKYKVVFNCKKCGKHKYKVVNKDELSSIKFK